MQLKFEQLGSHLKSSLAPFYFLWGDEALLVQETADAIRACAQAQGFSERCLFVMESEQHFEWDSLTQSCTTSSLFADKKIIEVILHNTKLKDPPFVLNINPDIVLIIRANALSPGAKKSNWFKKINQHKEGVLIDHPFLNKRQLSDWIVKTTQARGLKLDAQSLKAMVEKNEGNVLAAHQEIEMLHFIHSLDAGVKPRQVGVQVPGLAEQIEARNFPSQEKGATELLGKKPPAPHKTAHIPRLNRGIQDSNKLDAGVRPRQVGETEELLGALPPASHKTAHLPRLDRGIQQITLKEYQAIMTLTCQSRFTPFDLQNAILAGDSNRVLHILSALDRAEAILILWVLSRSIRTLIQLKQYLTPNASIPAALQALSIWPSLAPLYTSAHQRLSLPTLTKSLKQAQQLDIDFKSGKTAAAFRELMALCLTLSTGR